LKLVSQEFTFDGTTSTSKGLMIVNMDNGIRSLPYLPSQQIVEEYPNHVNKPYFYQTKRDPLTFTVSFTLVSGTWTLSKKLEIAQWLYRNEYKTFVSDDYTGYVFYVIATNRADFMTADLSNGYFTVEFRMNAPFAYTTAGTTTVHDLSSNPTTTDVVVTNSSNIADYFYPEVEIELKSTSTGFSIVNLSDSNRETVFTGLDLLETITLQNEKKQILSDTGEYRYDEFNKVWLRLAYGTNTLRVTGNCVLTFNTQYPVFV
jgi:hypothetical protein